ncbi:hypothetical protein N9E47_03320 [Luminiphilus sp.]|nr:hypothetical protein [Luminiphilus sp.]
MKKNLISLAVAASVASTASIAVQAAQYVNPAKTGEVIMFPFYNADNGNATNMHVVNTTSGVKALKIRFVEYKNSEEVLDFNVYLSPRDHFAFGVVKNPNGEGGAVITSDNSCTVPALGSANGEFSGTTTEGADGSTIRTQPFVNYQYANSKDVDSSMARTLTGHVEVIEMGVVTGALAKAATHGATGVPAACASLVTAWSTGAWSGNDTDANMTAPSGGLYGLAYHINVTEAAAFGFEPTAIDDWANGVEHTNPGSLSPSLSDGDDDAMINTAGGTTTSVKFGSGQQATSGILATASISNDVMVNSAIGGQTDWVVSFPTKRFHVDLAGQGIAAPIAPFTGAWVGGPVKETPACEVVSVSQYDREEQFTQPSPDGFSPKPPAAAALSICNEVAVIAMGSGTDSALEVTTGKSNLTFPYSEGWMSMNFAQSAGTASQGQTVSGLPAIGFAAYKVSNGAMSYGNTAEYKTANVNSGI